MVFVRPRLSTIISKLFIIYTFFQFSIALLNEVKNQIEIAFNQNVDRLHCSCAINTEKNET